MLTLGKRDICLGLQKCAEPTLAAHNPVSETDVLFSTCFIRTCSVHTSAGMKFVRADYEGNLFATDRCYVFCRVGLAEITRLALDPLGLVQFHTVHNVNRNSLKFVFRDFHSGFVYRFMAHVLCTLKQHKDIKLKCNKI